MKKKLFYVFLVIFLFNILAISVIANKFQNDKNIVMANDVSNKDLNDISNPSTKGMENAPPMYPDFLDEIISRPRTIIYKIGSPYFTVNDVQQEIDPGRNTSPVIVNGRTLIPIRSLIEELGGAITWDNDTRTVDIFYNGTEISLIIDKTDVIITNLDTMEKSSYKLDVPAQIIDGRTMVPLRFVSEKIGGVVTWNEKSQEVTIKFNNP